MEVRASAGLEKSLLNLHLCIYVYTHTQTSKHTCMPHICQVCVPAYVYMYACVYISVYIYTYMCVFAYVACMQACMYVRTYVCICVDADNIKTHMHMCTGVHIYMHITICRRVYTHQDTFISICVYIVCVCKYVSAYASICMICF